MRTDFKTPEAEREREKLIGILKPSGAGVTEPGAERGLKEGKFRPIIVPPVKPPSEIEEPTYEPSIVPIPGISEVPGLEQPQLRIPRQDYPYPELLVPELGYPKFETPITKEPFPEEPTPRDRVPGGLLLPGYPPGGAGGGSLLDELRYREIKYDIKTAEQIQ